MVTNCDRSTTGCTQRSREAHLQSVDWKQALTSGHGDIYFYLLVDASISGQAYFIDNVLVVPDERNMAPIIRWKATERFVAVTDARLGELIETRT